jgi:REP element-mobilizing transposase RayT
MNDPLAFFLTWTTYGTWLPGDERGWVDANQPGIQASDPERQADANKLLQSAEVVLTPAQRELVMATIRAHCQVRGWVLHAVNARTNHVHVVVSGDCKPDVMMDQFKAWCSRRLNEQYGKRPRWWTKHGSTKWIFDDDYLYNATNYVVNLQDCPREED